MLKSSELLKKKICVTVFLDELFEELNEEAHETSAEGCQEVNSGVKIAEEPPGEQLNMLICENKISKERDDNDLSKTRPRKRRQQSKFGKSNNNLKRELSCCKEGEGQKLEAKQKPSKQIPPVKSPVLKPIAGAHKSIMTEEGFLKKSKIIIEKIDRGVDCTSKVLSFTKSTQFDLPDLNRKKEEVSSENKQLQTEEKYLADIQVLPKDAQSSEDNKKDEAERCKQKSAGECSPLKTLESATKEVMLFVGSSSEQISKITPEEVIRVWSTCKKVWNENVESDGSVMDCNADGNKVTKHYSAVLNANRNFMNELEKTKTYASPFLSSAGSDTKFLRSNRKIIECKQETKSAILEKSRAEETPALEQTKFRVLMEPQIKHFECRSKNFAEGDIFEELVCNCISQFGSKENLIFCDKALSEEANEVIVSEAKIQFLHSKTFQSISNHFAEVFTKQGNENLDRESEMIFAEIPYDEEDLQEIQDFKVENEISKTEFLKRINKTVEIFENASFNNLEDVNNELIIICEDIQKENFCADGWQGCGMSLSEMKELYLKDSKESTMYMIKIPFVKSTGNRFNDF